MNIKNEKKYHDIYNKYQDRIDSINNEIVKVKINKEQSYNRPSDVLENYTNKIKNKYRLDKEDSEVIVEEDNITIHDKMYYDKNLTTVHEPFLTRLRRKASKAREFRIGQVNSINKEKNRRDEFFTSLNNFQPLNTINQRNKSFYTNYKSLNDIEAYKKLSQINVIAFVGPPGTGKSSRANKIAASRNINYFIDDGLLIENGRIKAGSTAKRAETKIESVRQAIFMEKTQAATMIRALSGLDIDRLMILGTSDKMVYKICDNLQLKHPVEFIRITDVSTKEEQQEAQRMRRTQGSHAIPVTSIEIKHEFSGSYFDPIVSFMKKFGNNDNSNQYSDSKRTIVRPTFSAIGRNIISDEALGSIIKHILKDVKGLASVQAININTTSYGVIVKLAINLYYGYNAPKVMSYVQEILIDRIELYTSINILNVDLVANSILHEQGEAI